MTEIMNQIGLPWAYHHFAEGESPDPPFVLYLYPESDNFGADNIVYSKGTRVYLELYTDLKDPDMEANIESILESHGIFWEKSEVWIESESLYEVLYSFEMEVK
ncbi:MAG: hypothetical protein IJJ03_05780 [Mogibacterium sp.]|nr:hypothetical protein [Mogibacterium sp.]MBR0380325.1 hypothetical protein [Mogibacterium sp.]